MPAPVTVLVFDFDGTLVDSDDALVAPFLQLGVPREQIDFGHVISEECDRLGISLDRYVELYDTSVVAPFDGIEQVVGQLDRWALCSNKHPASGRPELARLGWSPEVAMFTDAFGWRHKSLRPLLDALGVAADAVAMVGDSDADLRCAQDVGARFAWAGWNQRVQAAAPDGVVLDVPVRILDLYG
ncbi:MAG: HAD-IA family hydrolase [Actinobacteria bacterium]|nr:HAD-IA family hydrolase [Actinomycetota bacterium]